MSFSAPGSPASDPDEREVLLNFLHWKREQVVATAEGLDEDELRWIEGRYLASPFPPREEEFVVDADLKGPAVIDAYWQRSQRTDEVVRAAASLAVACLGSEGAGEPAHVLLGLTRPVDLRWVVLHLIEETSQHAGHADATREMLDGRKMRA